MGVYVCVCVCLCVKIKERNFISDMVCNSYLSNPPNSHLL